MKKMNLLIVLLFTSTLFACNSAEKNEAQNNNTEETQSIGQSGVQDDASQKNVVQVAVSSKDHTTLVTAIKAGELVDALSNAGPFTVFAPTNEAFNKLPAGESNSVFLLSIFFSPFLINIYLTSFNHKTRNYH